MWKLRIKEGEEGEEISVVPANFIPKIIFKNLIFVKSKFLNLTKYKGML